MFKRASRSMFGPLIALTVAGFVAVAGNSFAQTDTAYRTTLAGGPDVAKITIIQTINDKGFTHHELESILPLLQDLRDARRICNARLETYYADVAAHRVDTKMSSDAAIQDCQRRLSDRQNKIWATISDRVGNDKANALRKLVEPTTEDVSRVVYTDVYLQRIDVMLANLDKLAAARIALNGGLIDTEKNGVQPASVETTTTVTTTVIPTPYYVTTPAVASEQDLVQVVENKIVVDEIGKSDYLIFMPNNRDLDPTDIQFMKEGHMKMWW